MAEDADTVDVDELVTAELTVVSEEVYATFNCAQVNEGSGLEVVAGGLQAEFGTGHDQVARGDSKPANDHRAMTLDPDSNSIGQTTPR